MAMVTDPDTIVYLRHFAIAQSLALEINTGMTHRLPIRALAGQACGDERKTRKAQLRVFDAWMRNTYERYSTPSTVKKALNVG